LTWDPESNLQIVECPGDNFAVGGTGIIPREDVAKYCVQKAEEIVCKKEGTCRGFMAIDIKYSEEEAQ
jgi:hypothetical protein